MGLKNEDPLLSSQIRLLILNNRLQIIRIGQRPQKFVNTPKILEQIVMKHLRMINRQGRLLALNLRFLLRIVNTIIVKNFFSFLIVLLRIYHDLFILVVLKGSLVNRDIGPVVVDP